MLHQGSMKTKTHTNTHPEIEPKTAPKFSQIKLGVDVHADSYRVVRQRRNEARRWPAPELFIVKNDQPGAESRARHCEPANQKPNPSFHTRVVGRQFGGACSLMNFFLGRIWSDWACGGVRAGNRWLLRPAGMDVNKGLVSTSRVAVACSQVFIGIRG